MTSSPASGRAVRPRAVRQAALAGVLAGALTLAVAEPFAAVISPASSPLVAVGGAFIDRTPAWLKDFAVQAFGTNDKLVLVVAMALVVALLGALAGVLALRSWALGAGLVLVLGAVAVAAVATRAGAGAFDVLPTVAGVLAGLIALRLLVNRIDVDGRSPASWQAAPTRRSFLVAATVTAGLAVLAGAGGRLLGATGRGVAAARAALRLPAPVRAAPPLPDGVTAPVRGVTPFVTPNADFYRIDTALAVPQVDASTWSLRVHGLVEREIEIGFSDLLDADLVESWTTLACVSNEVGGDLVGNARWLGYPVRALLARAVPAAGADMVLSRSVDGFTASTPLEALTDDRDALLAIGMNGEPLPVEHGYPVRLVVPGLYGFVSATKWVVDLEVTRFADRTAYWTERGWAAQAPIKTASRIDVPRPSAQLRAGRVVVGGVAWAQHRGIEAVEVRVDDGPWRQATLAASVGIDSWRQWSFQWDAGRGDHELRVRATDGSGQVQTGDEAPPVPDGATGWHMVPVRVT